MESRWRLFETLGSAWCSWLLCTPHTHICTYYTTYPDILPRTVENISFFSYHFQPFRDFSSVDVKLSKRCAHTYIYIHLYTQVHTLCSHLYDIPTMIIKDVLCHHKLILFGKDQLYNLMLKT